MGPDMRMEEGSTENGHKRGVSVLDCEEYVNIGNPTVNGFGNQGKNIDDFKFNYRQDIVELYGSEA